MTAADSKLASRIAQSSPALKIVSEEPALAAYEIDSRRPSAAIFPTSSNEVAEALEFAAAESLAVVPCGARTKLSIGAIPSRYDVALDVSGMNRVLAYEPRDLTLGVEPGTRFSSLAAVLAREKQFIPLDPPFAESATIGGIIAADSVSPLRQRFGGPRDFVLGMEFVTGYGAQSKSGGRVVKNVTGYDLHKPLIGSLGTLAVITRINFKTFPIPEREAGFVLKTPHFEEAHAFCRAVFESPLEPATLSVISGDLLDDIIAQRSAATPATTGDWSVFATAAGNEAVVARHRRDFFAIASRIHGAHISEVSRELCGEINMRFREFPRYAKNSGASAIVVRIACLRSALPTMIEQVTQIIRRSEIPASILVHAFGLIYLSLQPETGQAAEAAVSVVNSIFAAMHDPVANARIESAPVDLKQRVRIWGPRRDDFELMCRVKRAFDPGNILSPGRFEESV